jgi:hypothetical protein
VSDSSAHQNGFGMFIMVRAGSNCEMAEKERKKKK